MGFRLWRRSAPPTRGDGSIQEHRVFISHAGEDREQAALVVDYLESQDIRCWIAPRDVPAGQRYAQAILGAIEACEVFLLIFSANATSSPHVSNELEKGATHGKRILLVRLDSTDPLSDAQVSLFLGSYQWLDASSGDLASHLSEMASDLLQVLDSTTIPHPPPPAATTSHSSSQPKSPASREQSTKLAVGVDVGATKLTACVVDFDAPETESLAAKREYREPVPESANIRTVLEQTKDLVGRILAEHCSEHPPIGIGVAVPGQVDLRGGTLKFGPNLFRARNVPFKTYLSNAFSGIPIRVDNEVRCATRCELHIGIGRDFDSFACVFIGHGVGSGLAIDRRIHFGHNFCAGEVGHIKIALSGPPCVCGQIGCLETFVKAQAVVERAEAKATDWQGRELPTLLSKPGQPLSPEVIAVAIEEGDAAAQEVANEVADNLGLGIANYINLVNPAAVVIGGGLMEGFFFSMIEELTNAVQRNALSEVANTPIVQSAHSGDASMLGAALLFHPADVWPY